MSSLGALMRAHGGLALGREGAIIVTDRWLAEAPLELFKYVTGGALMADIQHALNDGLIDIFRYRYDPVACETHLSWVTAPDVRA